MINNKTVGVAGKVTSMTGEVYSPEEGWAYSHHASITYYRDRFWAVWSNGILNEDDIGQRILLAESDDGLHWTNVRPLVTPELLGDEKKVLTAAGFHICGERLNVYYGYYKYAMESKMEEYKKARHFDTGLGVISTIDGEHWSEPGDIGVRIVPNHGPETTSTGRLIISGNMMFPYTDNPGGVDDYHITGVYGDAFGDKTPYDDEDGHHFVSRVRGWLPEGGSICEGSFYETDDQVLHMMLRTDTHILWHSESRDNGVTWTDPNPTAYSDGGSKFHFGRLPDGRFYGVSNPVPGSRRTPLSICISEDGENFDKQYIIRDEPYEKKTGGRYKGVGIYGYPHTLIHDGCMYVIYSKCKEAVEVTKFALEQLK